MSHKKTCPKCGKEFTCFIKDNCWCAKVELSDKQRNMLREKYVGCLCQSCLVEISKQ
jgi:hypothetical protein